MATIPGSTGIPSSILKEHCSVDIRAAQSNPLRSPRGRHPPHQVAASAPGRQFQNVSDLFIISISECAVDSTGEGRLSLQADASSRGACEARW